MKKSNSVLIVDDSIPRHIRFSEIFKELNFDVDFSFGPHDAIQKLGMSVILGAPYDMICLDHDLSVLDDGRNLCNWLAENSSACPSKVFIHSQNHICAEQMERIITNIRKSDGSTPLVKRIPFKSKPSL